MKSEDVVPAASAHTAASLNQTMASGSAWMIAMRWVIRLLGLANTVILVRILAPEDFGLFAIAMLVVAFAEIVGTAGQKLAIIRHPDPTREHMDAAWTASLLVGVGLGLLVILSAPAVAILFDEPRAELLIYILSVRIFIVGFENIGVVMFRRELNFKKEFKYNIYQKALVVVVTISLALMLQNYWALVAGSIVGHILFLGVGVFSASLSAADFVYPYPRNLVVFRMVFVRPHWRIFSNEGRSVCRWHVYEHDDVGLLSCWHRFGTNSDI